MSQINWCDLAQVIAYAKRLGPGYVVVKHGTLDAYNIVHAARRDRWDCTGVAALFFTSGDPRDFKPKGRPVTMVAIRANSLTMSNLVAYLRWIKRDRSAETVYRNAQVTSVPGRELVSYLSQEAITAVLGFTRRERDDQPWLRDLFTLLARSLLDAKLDPARHTRQIRA